MKSTVLVVDDDRAIRQLFRQLLEEEGFTVREAVNGGPALDQLRASTEGMVVLLGLMMPYVDGEEVLRAVEADPVLATRHRIIMVAASRRAEEIDMVALRERLSVPLVWKPRTADALLAAVEDAAASLA